MCDSGFFYLFTCFFSGRRWKSTSHLHGGISFIPKGMLRWLVFFICYNDFEMRKVFRKLFLTMWANYEHLYISCIRQYSNTDCDVLLVTMATIKAHKNFSYIKKGIF